MLVFIVKSMDFKMNICKYHSLVTVTESANNGEKSNMPFYEWCTHICIQFLSRLARRFPSELEMVKRRAARKSMEKFL